MNNMYLVQQRVEELEDKYAESTRQNELLKKENELLKQECEALRSQAENKKSKTYLLDYCNGMYDSTNYPRDLLSLFDALKDYCDNPQLDRDLSAVIVFLEEEYYGVNHSECSVNFTKKVSKINTEMDKLVKSLELLNSQNDAEDCTELLEIQDGEVPEIQDFEVPEIQDYDYEFPDEDEEEPFDIKELPYKGSSAFYRPIKFDGQIYLISTEEEKLGGECKLYETNFIVKDRRNGEKTFTVERVVGQYNEKTNKISFK